MPGAEIIKQNQSNVIVSNCFDKGNRLKSQENEGFLVEFNEDGAPIDCHKVIVYQEYTHNNLIISTFMNVILFSL